MLGCIGPLCLCTRWWLPCRYFAFVPFWHSSGWEWWCRTEGTVISCFHIPSDVSPLSFHLPRFFFLLFLGRPNKYHAHHSPLSPDVPPFPFYFSRWNVFSFLRRDMLNTHSPLCHFLVSCLSMFSISVLLRSLFYIVFSYYWTHRSRSLPDQVCVCFFACLHQTLFYRSLQTPDTQRFITS